MKSEQYTPDSMDWTPEAAIKQALRALKDGEIPDCDECLILFRFAPECVQVKSWPFWK
jgi:hypothetical protein